MHPLARAFCSACSTDPIEGLVAALDRALDVARTAHADLVVDAERFAAALGQRFGREPDVLAAIGSAHVADLYLALACEGSVVARERVLALLHDGIAIYAPMYESFDRPYTLVVATMRELGLSAVGTYEARHALGNELMLSIMTALMHAGWDRSRRSQQPRRIPLLDLSFVPLDQQTTVERVIDDAHQHMGPGRMYWQMERETPDTLAVLDTLDIHPEQRVSDILAETKQTFVARIAESLRASLPDPRATVQEIVQEIEARREAIFDAMERSVPKTFEEYMRRR